MLKPVQLLTLTVVVRTRSFSEAGRELGYSPSAVAQQVASLERTLGVELFERESQRIRPTPAALLLAERSRHVLDILETLEHDARALALGRLGRIGIGSALDPGAGLVADTLTLLKETGPGLDVGLDDGPPDALIERVHVGALDVALVYDYPLASRELDSDLTAAALDEAPLQLVTPAGWKTSWRLRELADHDWIVGLGSPDGERALSALCGEAGFVPRVRLATTNRDLVFGLVAAELGVGVVPPVTWRLPSGVGVRPLEEAGASRRTLAVYLRNRRSPALRAVLRGLRGAALRERAQRLGT